MAPNLFTGTSFPVSVKTVVKAVQMLISTGHVDAFLAHCEGKQVIVTIPAETANILKQYLHDNNVIDPIAISITGTRQEECNDYQCPHISNG